MSTLVLFQVFLSRNSGHTLDGTPLIDRLAKLCDPPADLPNLSLC